MRILAVDDDPQALRYIRDALAKAGYAVIATLDPGDVPRLMEEEEPQLVLLDVLLPGVDGVDLMKDIRDAGDVPVIFVSAYGQDQLRRQGLRDGSRRLRRQALLADRARSPDQGGPAQAHDFPSPQRPM